jgi:hypothetical protein
MFGIHHTLVWNGVLKNGRRWLLQILLWGLLRGKRRWRVLHVYGVFHPFEVRNLGIMVCIVSTITTESAREVSLNIVVFIPLSFVFIVPLGVLSPLILVAPSGMVLLGFISSWSQVIIVSFFPFILGIIQLTRRIFCIQLFKSLKLLNGRGLNKISVDMWVSLWRSNWLWRTREWKI